jgi:YD repeat-containing protein
LSAYTYQYYTDGNVYKVKDKDNVDTTYIYDGLGRLKSETFGSNYTKTYTYDTSNNRSKMVVTGAGAKTVDYAYDGNNRLTKETTTRVGEKDEYLYNYDPNGNQLARIKGTISAAGTTAPSLFVYLMGEPTISNNYDAEASTYDVFNRLVQIKKDGQTVNYTYRPDDLRHSKTVNGVKTTHIWDGGNIVLDLNNSNQVQNKYIRGIGLIAFDNGATRNYYLHNGHNDVVQLVGNTGVVTRFYKYDAFGIEES